MMLDAALMPFPDAPVRCPAYAAEKAAVSGRRARLDDRDWAAQMLAVRDRADRAAFAALFNHFAPRVKGFLMKSGMPAAQAEDCAQDVLATVWQKASLYDPRKAGVATWIFAIARNRRIDVLRKSRRPEPQDLDWGGDGEAPDQAEVFAAEEEARGLGQALQALPAAQRSLIERAFWGDRSHGQLAAETGLPLGTIKSRIRLALDRLRRDIAKDRDRE